jgi:hypothetical protein
MAVRVEKQGFRAFPVVTVEDIAESDFMRTIDYNDPAEIKLLETTISTATDYVESYTGFTLASTTFAASFDAPPCRVDFPGGRLLSVESVNIVAADGSEALQDPSLYTVVTGDKGFLYLNENESWSETERLYDVMRIIYKMGYATKEEISFSFINAILTITAHNMINREGLFTIPDGAKDLMNHTNRRVII